MDVVTHALWGGITLGRRSRQAFLVALGISLFPDVTTEGLFGALYFLNIGNMPGWEQGHPNIALYPLWAQTAYNVTHSLFAFTAIFLLIWALARKPVWLVCAWGLHILIDIPTHSMNLFPTPFLWPVSDYRFDGVGWHNPIVFGVNVLLLLATYGVWFRRNKGSHPLCAQEVDVPPGKANFT